MPVLLLNVFAAIGYTVVSLKVIDVTFDFAHKVAREYDKLAKPRRKKSA